MQKKFQEIDFNLAKLNEQIFKYNGMLTAVQRDTQVNSHLLECAEMTLEYELELELLTDAILLARRGLLHPKILTPKELFDTLRDTQFMPNGRRLPVTLEPNQFNNLIDASDIKIFYKDHRLVYVIEIPLIESHDFLLYHAIPLPVKQNGEDVYAFINPTYTHYGLRTDKQMYTPFSEDSISKCKTINDALICKQTDLLYQIAGTHNCESELLKSARLENLLEKCDIRLMKIYNTAWFQLHAANSWLFTAPREETLHILCKDDKPRQTQLISTGLIQLSPDCDAISDNALLHSQSVAIVSTMSKDFVPKVNLSTNKLCEDIKKHNVNISELPLLNIGKIPRLDVNSLKIASSSLNELYREAEEIGKHHRTKTLYEKVTSWLYYIVYTIGGLVIIYLVLKCRLLCKCINIFKLCCVPREGCSQYFYNCFNTKVRAHDVHLPELRRDTVVTPTFTETTEFRQNVGVDRQTYNRNQESRRSRSRNTRLSKL